MVSRALLLVSHGTVDDLDDLDAFVTNVRRGQRPGPELIAELRRRYEAIGGRSPLNAIDAELARKLEALLGVRVAWANRLWKPYVRDVLGELVSCGARRVALVPLAQHSAQVYAEDARRAAEGMPLELTCADNWGQRGDLCAAFATRIQAAVAAPTSAARTSTSTTVVMTAHSLPKAVVERGDPYEREVRSAAEAIASRVRQRLGQPVRFATAFQSQGLSAPGPQGRPMEWLGPDLRATLDEVAARGDTSVVFAPVGFLADHVEILYDLDIEARAMASERNLHYSRAASLNTDDDLVAVIAAVARPLLGDPAA